MSDAAYTWRTNPVVTARSRTQARYAEPPAWVPPTGDTWPVVRVVPNERTCLGCGDVFVGEFCIRCGARDEQAGARRTEQPPSVRTVDYLRVGEYEVKP